MDIDAQWKKIKTVVEVGQASKIHCAIASVNPQGIPNVTPIGTVFLRDDKTGFYFDKYSSQLGENLKVNPNICLMAVNAGRLFWFLSFLRGKFLSPPGVRLYGTVSDLRPATADEIRMIRRRTAGVMWMKGARLLWSDFTHVRDITFTSFRPVIYPVMMENVW
jgi:pyridoxine/pyridoxamine 5'-phosphate oxidase